MLDLVALAARRLEVEDAQAEMGGQRDVLGLADIEAFAIERVEAELAAGADRRQPFSARFVSTYLQATWSSATGSVANKSALFSQVHSGRLALGPPGTRP